MEIRPIRTDGDHAEAVREIERLWNAADGTAAADKLDVLATLVAAYEDRRWPLTAASPLAVLDYATTEMGRSQSDLAELLGSRSQASDLLTGRRRVSLELARKISSAWRIPIELLVAPYPTEGSPSGSKTKRFDAADRTAMPSSHATAGRRTKTVPRRPHRDDIA